MTRIVLARLGLLAGLLLLWELWAGRQNPLLYVPPSRVWPALQRVLALETYPTLVAHFGVTAFEVLVAYALAVGLGVTLGFVLGLSRHVGEIYEPLLAALYAIPSVVWYPSLMLFFGLGPASKIAFGVLLGFFPIVLAVLAGIRSVDPHLLTVARGFGAGPGTCFVKVILPAITATLLAGLRAGLQLQEPQDPCRQHRQPDPPRGVTDQCPELRRFADRVARSLSVVRIGVASIPEPIGRRDRR